MSALPDAELLLVPITVTVKITASGNGIAISVDPDPILAPINGHYKITWEMDASSLFRWDFDATAGIYVRYKKGKFHTPQGPNVAPKKFSWKHDPVDRGDFNYTITLTDGTNDYTLDPTIRNQ